MQKKKKEPDIRLSLKIQQVLKDIVYRPFMHIYAQFFCMEGHRIYSPIIFTSTRLGRMPSNSP